MNLTDLVTWSAAGGALTLLALASLLEFLVFGASLAWRLALWNLLAGVTVLVLSGVSTVLIPELPLPVAHGLLLVVAPLFVSLTHLNFRQLLPPWNRGPWINTVLWVGIASGPLLALAVLIPGVDVPLEASAGVALTSCAALFLVAALGALRGVRLAPGMALLSLLCLPILVGLYVGRADQPLESGAQALLAVLAVLCCFGSTRMVLLRTSGERKARLRFKLASDRDLLTHVYNSAGIVRRIVQAQKRLGWMGGSGTLLGFEVRNPEQIQRLYGRNALDRLYVSLAGRLMLHVGNDYAIGRYGPDTFVVVVDNSSSASKLNRLTGRLFPALLDPVPIARRSDEAAPIHPELGFAMIDLKGQGSVDGLLFKLQQAARSHRLELEGIAAATR